ncbi:DUF4430 domain-containing protein [Klebsiella pneumoniae]|nr:DUF4430 domain-containing protein [Klebsiella pneumoniae]
MAGMTGSLETKKAPNSGRWWMYSGNEKAPIVGAGCYLLKLVAI